MFFDLGGGGRNDLYLSLSSVVTGPSWGYKALYSLMFHYNYTSERNQNNKQKYNCIEPKNEGKKEKGKSRHMT